MIGKKKLYGVNHTAHLLNKWNTLKYMFLGRQIVEHAGELHRTRRS
jgi:hypothetical protein